MVLILANKIITIFVCITQAENEMNISDHDFGSDFSKTTKSSDSNEGRPDRFLKNRQRIVYH